MKYQILSLLLIIFSLANSQSFFDTESIQTIEISFSQNNWDDILDTYKTAGSEYRLIGTVSLNGEPFDSVGVRYKGNSSYNASNIKNPLNIKLDYVKGKQEIEGRNVLKLSNVFRDPSFVREVISYEIARKYMPSSESNYAKVFVNGTFIGLYVNDESTNLSFMGRHFFKSNHAYFEGEFDQGPPQTGCPGGPPSVFGYLGTDTTCYKKYYTIQSNNPNDWNQLRVALDTFNNQPLLMDNGIYIDRLLWMLAFDNLMVNLDSPINPPHNFTLYRDNTKRFNPLLWDLNESFGSFNNVSGSGGTTTLTNTELKEFSPWFNATNPQYPILTKPFANDRYKKMYIAKMKTIFNENINNDLYKERIETLQTLISTAVNDDVNKFYSTAEFTQNKTATVQGRIGLEELMEGRKTYLNSHPDFLKVAPTVSTISNSPAEVHSNSTVTITAEITNATYAYVGYRFSPKEKFTILQMNNNGNTYTADLNVQYADLQYYIWAENNDAGIFSPERAEYEFHKIGVTGNVVINELQSSNKTTQFDEAVEYDDWVELHNNTDADIDLTGYYLSDNKDTLTKWAIPSQTIPANGYLIFWADKDLIQGTNHTNFQLTKNGESLYLINPSESIVDQITYTHMPTDMSFSRFPNGRGAFHIKEPTYNKTNGDTVTSIINIDKNKLKVSLYPSPTDDFLVLYSSEKNLFGKTISILDITGKLLYKANWSNSNRQKLNVTSLSAGIYFIDINNESTLKFIKN